MLRVSQPANRSQRFPALSHKNFRRYFLGQSIALTGGFAFNVALAWLAYRLSGSAFILGLVGFASTIPMVFVSPFAGVWGDRHPRKRTLQIVLWLAVLNCFALAFLTWKGWVTIPIVVMFAVFRGIIFAIEVATRHAFLSELIDDRKVLPNAIALHSSVLNAARLVGPAVGGYLILHVSEAACFALHGAALLATLFGIAGTRPKPGHNPHATGSALAQLQEGFRYAFASYPIRTLLIQVAIVGVTVSAYSFLMPSAVAEAYTGRPDIVGNLIAAAGAGSMIAAISLAARKDIRGLSGRLLWASITAGSAFLAFALIRNVWFAYVAMFALGFGIISQAGATNMIIQSIVDDDKRGRVMAIYTAMFIGASPIGSLLLGQLGEHIGTMRAFAVGGVLCLVGAAYYYARLARFRAVLRTEYERRGIIETPASPR